MFVESLGWGSVGHCHNDHWVFFSWEARIIWGTNMCTTQILLLASLLGVKAVAVASHLWDKVQSPLNFKPIPKGLVHSTYHDLLVLKL